MTEDTDAQAERQPIRAAVCPYCSVILPKRPQRKSRCGTCWRPIFVKTLPNTRERILVTEEQATVIEAAWTAHAQERAVEQTVRRIGLSVLEFQALRATEPRLSVRDLIWRLLNQGLQELMTAGDLDGLKSRYYEMALFCAEGDRPFAHLLEQSHEMELRSYIQTEVVQRVQILSAGEGNSCPGCLRMHGRVFSLQEALRAKPLPCQECTSVVVGSTPGFCRCCYVPLLE